MTAKEKRELYETPVLKKHENLIELTLECVDWQCSVTLPVTGPQS